MMTLATTASIVLWFLLLYFASRWIEQKAGRRARLSTNKRYATSYFLTTAACAGSGAWLAMQLFPEQPVWRFVAMLMLMGLGTLPAQYFFGRHASAPSPASPQAD